MSYKQQKNFTVTTIVTYNYNIIYFIYIYIYIYIYIVIIYNYITQQERQCTYNATLWRVRAAFVAVEKQ